MTTDADMIRSKKARRAAQTIHENPANHMYIDFETTGLDGFIVQVGMVTHGFLWQATIDPCVPVEQGAFDVHGLPDEYLSDMENLPRYIEQMADFSEFLTFVAYRASFERKILSNEADRAGWESDTGRAIQSMLNQPWIDLAQVYAEWMAVYKDDGSLKYWKLNGDHSALGDCLAMIELAEHIATTEEPTLYTPDATR